MSVLLLRADARNIPLACESVQCVVTSPPYWGLRMYSGDQSKEPFGLEPTIGLYIEHTVSILRAQSERATSSADFCSRVSDLWPRNRARGSGRLQPSPFMLSWTHGHSPFAMSENR